MMHRFSEQSLESGTEYRASEKTMPTVTRCNICVFVPPTA